MLIKDLPKEIQQLVELRRTNGKQTALASAFTWSNTPEGNYFWYEIQTKDFQPFYDKYTKGIKVGDSCEVIKPEHTYPSYLRDSMKGFPVVPHWKNNRSPCTGFKGIVTNIRLHVDKTTWIVSLENDDVGESYIISIEGIELVSSNKAEQLPETWGVKCDTIDEFKELQKWCDPLLSGYIGDTLGGHYGRRESGNGGLGGFKNRYSFKEFKEKFMGQPYQPTNGMTNTKQEENGNKEVQNILKQESTRHRETGIRVQSSRRRITVESRHLSNKEVTSRSKKRIRISKGKISF